MQNKIHYLTAEEYDKITFDESTRVVVLDGSELQTWDAYAKNISEKFKFPYSEYELNYYGYVDWMTDLSWISENKYVVVIKHFSDFMKNDLNEKEDILCSFSDEILPFWEEEVERVVVGGKKTQFNVYCVN